VHYGEGIVSLRQIATSAALLSQIC